MKVSNQRACALFAIKTPVLLRTAHHMTYGVLGMGGLRPIDGVLSNPSPSQLAL
jgi:hypothetical protein